MEPSNLPVGTKSADGTCTDRVGDHGRLFEVGQWYWVTDSDEEWLGCITKVGSNHVQLDGPNDRYSSYRSRVHFDKAHSVLRPHEDPEAYISNKVALHQAKAAELMGEIMALTAKLGLQPAGELSDGSGSTALVAAHHAENVKAHQKALVVAKETTLPELFEKIEKEHGIASTWMKSGLIPLKSKTALLKEVTETIEDRIFAVELYAGLIEKVERIRDGKPADNGEKIHLFQRRHYMDEECLVDYQAGGMEFEDIHAFDNWVLKGENLARILPLPRCVVAFQVRRANKDREAESVGDFIRFAELEQADETTYLYIRNGEQVYRLTTGVDFGPQLFPDMEHSQLLNGGQLYIKHSFGVQPVTEAEYQDVLAERKAAKAEYKRETADWPAMPARARAHHREPWFRDSHDSDSYEPLTPASVYYDDAMAVIQKQIQHHNRVATVLQGLLDRSAVFKPHPPWQLWTAEGFTAGLVLHYDETRALTDGPAPDFEAYRSKLNESIEKGTHTVGQELRWEVFEADKENDRQECDHRIRSPIYYKRYSPYGNPGPGLVAPIATLSRDGAKATFRWERERLRPKWVMNPTRPGYEMRDPSGVAAQFTCKTARLLNVDAYQPGDYRQFYEDPRTRQDYLKWAPLLLAAEDWHAEKKESR